MKTYDYINRVVITLTLSIYEGTWKTLSPLVAMDEAAQTDITRTLT